MFAVLGQKVKAGAPFHPPRLCQSCMTNNRRNHPFPVCVGSVASLRAGRAPFSPLALSSPSHVLSPVTEELRRRLYACDGEGPNGDDAFIRHRRVCETACSRRQTVFHTYVRLTESRDVAIVWEVSAGGVQGECWQWSGRSDWVTIPTGRRRTATALSCRMVLKHLNNSG